MGTLSLRMRDELERKAQRLAKAQGVSLSSFINAAIAAVVAQQDTISSFGDRLKDVDQPTLHKRVLKFMRKTRRGKEPGREQINCAMRGS